MASTVRSSRRRAAAFAAACRSARNQPPTPSAIEAMPTTPGRQRPPEAGDEPQHDGQGSPEQRGLELVDGLGLGRAVQQREVGGQRRSPGGAIAVESEREAAQPPSERRAGTGVGGRAGSAGRPIERGQRGGQRGPGGPPPAGGEPQAGARDHPEHERDHHGSTDRMRSPAGIPARRTSAQNATNHIPQTTASTACPTGVPKGAR